MTLNVPYNTRSRGPITAQPTPSKPPTKHTTSTTQTMADNQPTDEADPRSDDGTLDDHAAKPPGSSKPSLLVSLPLQSVWLLH